MLVGNVNGAQRWQLNALIFCWDARFCLSGRAQAKSCDRKGSMTLFWRSRQSRWSSTKLWITATIVGALANSSTDQKYLEISNRGFITVTKNFSSENKCETRWWRISAEQTFGEKLASAVKIDILNKTNSFASMFELKGIYFIPDSDWRCIDTRDIRCQRPKSRFLVVIIL